MRSLSCVKLLAVCGLIVAVQLGATTTEVSGFGCELLSAFESRLELLNEKLDLFLSNSSHSFGQLSAQIKEVAAVSSSKLEAQLRKDRMKHSAQLRRDHMKHSVQLRKDRIKHSAQLRRLNQKFEWLAKTSANNFTSLRSDLAEHSRQTNASLVYLSRSGERLSKHVEQRLEVAPSGVFTTKYNTSLFAFRVYREGMQYHGYGANWTVFQRRFDGSVDFNRSWWDYENCFGDIGGEHWLGLDKLRRILTSERHELLIELVSFAGNIFYAKYDDFQIADYSERFRIKSIGRYAGSAGDALQHHLGTKFATYDKNDVKKCALQFGGGGWYHNCYDMNLNGLYCDGRDRKCNGIVWNFSKNDPFKASKMMVRPYSYNGRL